MQPVPGSSSGNQESACTLPPIQAATPCPVLPCPALLLKLQPMVCRAAHALLPRVARLHCLLGLSYIVHRAGPEADAGAEADGEAGRPEGGASSGASGVQALNGWVACAGMRQEGRRRRCVHQATGQLNVWGRRGDGGGAAAGGVGAKWTAGVSRRAVHVGLALLHLVSGTPRHPCDDCCCEPITPSPPCSGTLRLASPLPIPRSRPSTPTHTRACRACACAPVCPLLRLAF